MLFGHNPNAAGSFAPLGKEENDCGRFRDIYVDERDIKMVIAVYIWNGGGNRERHGNDCRFDNNRENCSRVLSGEWELIGLDYKENYSKDGI